MPKTTDNSSPPPIFLRKSGSDKKRSKLFSAEREPTLNALSDILNDIKKKKRRRRSAEPESSIIQRPNTSHSLRRSKSRGNDTADPHRQYHKLFLKPKMTGMSSKFRKSPYAGLFDPIAYNQIFIWLKQSKDPAEQKRFHRLFKKVARGVLGHGGGLGADHPQENHQSAFVRVEAPFTYTNVYRAEKAYDRDFHEAVFYGHGVFKEQTVHDIALWMRDSATRRDKEHFLKCMSSLRSHIRLNHPKSHTQETFMEQPNIDRDKTLRELPRTIAARKYSEELLARDKEKAPSPQHQRRAVSELGFHSRMGRSKSLDLGNDRLLQKDTRSSRAIFATHRRDREIKQAFIDKSFNIFAGPSAGNTTTNKQHYRGERAPRILFGEHVVPKLTASTGAVTPKEFAPTDSEAREYASAATNRRAIVRVDQRSSAVKGGSFKAVTTYRDQYPQWSDEFIRRSRGNGAATGGRDMYLPWAYEDPSKPNPERYTREFDEVGAFHWRIPQNDELYGHMVDDRPTFMFRKPALKVMRRLPKQR